MGLLFELGVFLAVSLVILAAAWALRPREDKVKSRLAALRLGDAAAGEPAPVNMRSGIRGLIDRLGGVGRPVAERDLRKERTDPKGSAGTAGFLFLKFALMAGLPATWFVVLRFAGVTDPSYLMFGAFILAPTGMFLPNAIRNAIEERRRDQLRRGLPDVLDLMVICVEAGMSLNAAFKRVAEKIQEAQPAIAGEFLKLHQEIQAGRSREDALRAMGERVAVDEIRSLTAMMIQTERLGTSISKALRIHSDAMRTKFHYQAEARAARATVTLAFPLVLCIFPALLVVVVGPAAIRIWAAFDTIK